MTLEKSFKKIYKEHKKQLKNLNVQNKKLIICFVGIPCSGKTYIAKKIEKKYNAVRINSDDIRKIIDKNITKKEEDGEIILGEHILNLLKNPVFTNKLIILDRGIERNYEDILKISKSKRWNMFIIKMVVPKNLIIKRIEIKDRERLEKHPEDIKRWFKEYKIFNKNIKADFVFKNDSDLERLFERLDEIT